MKTSALLLSASMLLAACAQSTPPQPRVAEVPPTPLIHLPVSDSSGIIGPGGGAALGSVIGGGNVTKYSIIAGLAIGYLVHGSNGPTLSGMAASEQRHAMARIMDAPLGAAIRWRTSADQASGEITPTSEFRDKAGERCRNYTETRIVRASHGSYIGTACLAR
jgi:surface antigen